MSDSSASLPTNSEQRTPAIIIVSSYKIPWAIWHGIFGLQNFHYLTGLRTTARQSWRPPSAFLPIQPLVKPSSPCTFQLQRWGWKRRGTEGENEEATGSEKRVLWVTNVVLPASWQTTSDRLQCRHVSCMFLRENVRGVGKSVRLRLTSLIFFPTPLKDCRHKRQTAVQWLPFLLRVASHSFSPPAILETRTFFKKKNTRARPKGVEPFTTTSINVTHRWESDNATCLPPSKRIR